MNYMHYKLMTVEECYSDIRNFKGNWNERNMTYEILRRKDLTDKDILLEMIMLFCYYHIPDKYKKLIPTNSSDCNIVVKKNEMGINFTVDVDIDYIKNLEKLLIDSNYQYKYYDVFYYHNLCNMDIDEIKIKYPNLDLSTIRDVLMYSNKEKLEEIFNYLNNKSVGFQGMFCRLITPMIIDVTENGEIANCREISQFINYIMNNEEPSKDFYDELYKNLNDTYKYKKEILRTNNPKYIALFNSYFFDLVIKNKNDLDEELLDKLCKIKEFALNNIVQATGKISYKPKYENVKYDVDDGDRESAGYFSHSEWRVEHVGDIKVNTINYYEDTIIKQREIYEAIFQMFKNGKIDYEKLFEFDNSSFINELIDYINKKGKVKEYENKKCSE